MKEILLNAGTAIIGDGRKLNDVSILIKGEVINQIGSNVTGGPDAEVLDYSDRTIMPGIIDTHIHIVHDETCPDPAEMRDLPDEYLSIRATTYTRKILQYGVTTVADAGARGEVSLAVKKAIEMGYAIGPRFLACGRMITITGGRDPTYGPLQADGPDGVRKATRSEIARGVDLIKLAATGAITSTKTESMSPQFTIEELSAAAEEAHKVGKKAHAHAYGDVGITNTILSGVDVVVHGHPMSQTCIELMKKHGTLYMPTFVTYYESIQHHDEGLLPDYMVRKEKELFPLMEEGLRNAVKAGLEIVVGSDSGCPYTPFGVSSMEELDLLVRYGGMTEMDAIVAGTKNAARALNIDSYVGTLEPGLSADLLVLKEGQNPLDDISILQEPTNLECIFLKGKRVE
ncbi:MAG: amidohydrolase family protein [Candidatus Thorarchaeota archaeon]